MVGRTQDVSARAVLARPLLMRLCALCSPRRIMGRLRSLGDGCDAGWASSRLLGWPAPQQAGCRQAASLSVQSVTGAAYGRCRWHMHGMEHCNAQVDRLHMPLTSAQRLQKSMQRRMELRQRQPTCGCSWLLLGSSLGVLCLCDGGGLSSDLKAGPRCLACRAALARRRDGLGAGGARRQLQEGEHGPHVLPAHTRLVIRAAAQCA